jgi:polysaccharide export outer membrane protein
MTSAQADEVDKIRLIAPNDTLLITVLENKNLTTLVTVRKDGKITFPLIGEVEAASLTVPELTAKIKAALASYFTDPHVNIIISESKKEVIYVIGEVQTPGQFEVPYPMSALRALTLAGGSKIESADLANARLIKNSENSRQVIPIDLSQYTKDSEENGESREENDKAPEKFKMTSGDILIIPSLFESEQISVLGYVHKPGRYKVKGKLKFIEALAVAGGAIEELTDLSNVKLIKKGGQIIDVNYQNQNRDGNNGNNSATSIEVIPGDTIVVLDGKRLNVLGYVNNPGRYLIKGQIDIVEALSMAGGPVEEEANLKKIRILRSDGKKEVANASQIWEGKRKDKSILLNPGDTLIVPKSFSVNWNAIYIIIILLVTLESVIQKTL